MKKFLVFLSAIFMCTFAIAHSIEWYVDDSLYQTTTCNSGDSVTPPTAPEKYGYHFVEWTGYTQLEYIESTGTQWIDTGIKGNMSYKYDIEFQQLDAGQYRKWGAFNQQTFDGGPNMSLTYAVGVAVRWTVSGNSSQLVNLPSIDTKRHHLVINNGNVTWDGVDKGRSTGHQSNYALNYNLFLGTVNPGGTTPTANAKSKYYSYKVWNSNGELLQNFVPAKRNSDNVVGMYDTVTETFFTSSGTGEFVAGPEVGGL